MRGLLVLVGVVVLAGCSSLGRAMEYRDAPVAQFVVQGQGFKVFQHPDEPALLIQLYVADAAARGFVRGMTMGVADTTPDYDRWKAGAEWMVRPAGCEVRDLKPVHYGSTWEFTYVCPPGVDLRALIEAQREQLRNGVQLDLAR